MAKLSGFATQTRVFFFPQLVAMDSHSETRLIGDLKVGDELAAQRLWELYFHRLVGLARAKLGGLPGREATAEDVAVSAFKSLCLGARRGNFPDLNSRDNLWPLLLVITSRKASKLVAYERRQKRGGGKLLPNADIVAKGELSPLEELISREPTAEFSLAMAEQCEHLLSLLDDQARSIALAKMEGLTNAEIAAQHSVALRTVERKLQLIRRIWERAGSEGN